MVDNTHSLHILKQYEHLLVGLGAKDKLDPFVILFKNNM
jgi:hypothetical protein